jgi:hypothetical protein
MLGTNFGFSEKISAQMDETDESEQAHSVVFDMPYGLDPQGYRKIQQQYQNEADRLHRKDYQAIVRTPYEWNHIDDDPDVAGFEQFTSYINVALKLGARASYVHVDWDEFDDGEDRDFYDNITNRFRTNNVMSLVPFNKSTPEWMIDRIGNEIMTGFYIDISRMIDENHYPYGDEVLNNTLSMIVDYEKVEKYYISEKERDKAIYKDSAKKAFSRVFDHLFDPFGSSQYVTIDAETVDEYNHAIKQMDKAGVFKYA